MVFMNWIGSFPGDDKKGLFCSANVFLTAGGMRPGEQIRQILENWGCGGGGLAYSIPVGMTGLQGEGPLLTNGRQTSRTAEQFRT